jgi:uncharacterized protein (TIGR02246 family)
MVMERHERAMRDLYIRLLTGWNDRDAGAMAACFSEHATMIGFDGSLAIGRRGIEAHLAPIFRDHPTAAFVTLIREVRPIGDAMLLRADVGMVPPGKSEIRPETNARQVAVAHAGASGLVLELFQSTPAALHADEAGQRQLTEELNDTYAERGPFPVD